MILLLLYVDSASICLLMKFMFVDTTSMTTFVSSLVQGKFSSITANMVSGFVVNLEILYMYYHFIFALDLDLSWKATAVFSIDRKDFNFLGKLFSRTGTWTVRENNFPKKSKATLLPS